MPLYSASARVGIEVASPSQPPSQPQPQQPKVVVPVSGLVLAVLGAVGAGVATYATTRNVAASVAVSSLVGVAVYGVLKQKNL
jgi:hypothetical protein